jgi:ABC-2 type transport system permease protein
MANNEERQVLLEQPNRANPSQPSSLRAWIYLVYLSWQRQARANWMVWIALGLLGLTLFLVYLNTRAGRWTFPRFSQGMVLSVYVSFLVPLWTLSFATEALGREREARNLIWVLTRPLSRPAIYLGKYLAVLPWCFLLNLGGFALICLAAGEPGRQALEVYWPPLIGTTLAYAALFHGLAALVRRPAVLALLYAFFAETVAGNLPGHLKRLSITYYTNSLLYERAQGFGLPLERAAFYQPISPGMAWTILLSGTAALLLAGTLVFARSEYLDVD